MSDQQKETLIEWLNDAYAMENSLVETLKRHSKQAEDHPEVQSKIEEHLEQTKEHAELVKACVESLGGSTSAVKKGMGEIGGMISGLGNAASEDVLVKNAIADFAAEHMEIASYNAIKTAAKQLGEDRVVKICDQILEQEQEMADWLEENMPSAVREFVEEKANA